MVSRLTCSSVLIGYFHANPSSLMTARLSQTLPSRPSECFHHQENVDQNACAYGDYTRLHVYSQAYTRLSIWCYRTHGIVSTVFIHTCGSMLSIKGIDTNARSVFTRSLDSDSVDSAKIPYRHTTGNGARRHKRRAALRKLSRREDKRGSTRAGWILTSISSACTATGYTAFTLSATNSPPARPSYKSS